MRSTELGRTNEKIPVIGLGTWKYGADEKKEVEALEVGIDAGAKFIDTAELYGSEGIVGKAVKGRDDVFIASKVFSSHLKYDEVLAACDASLKRLGIKTIDLYQLHFPNHSVPISETMSAMELLVKQGKIRYIGVSNFSINELEEARAVMKSNEIVSDQVEFSILARDAEKGRSGTLPRKREDDAHSIQPARQRRPLHSKVCTASRRTLHNRQGSRKDRNADSACMASGKRRSSGIRKAASKEHVLEDIGSRHPPGKGRAESINTVIGSYTKAPVWPGGVFRTLLKHTTFWYKRSSTKYGNKMNE